MFDVVPVMLADRNIGCALKKNYVWSFPARKSWGYPKQLAMDGSFFDGKSPSRNG